MLNNSVKPRSEMVGDQCCRQEGGGGGGQQGQFAPGLQCKGAPKQCSPLARAPYVALFDLKPLIEDGNLQVYMYCVHARKSASGAPKTHFRACKISKFPGGMPPDPPHITHFVGPHFLYLPCPPPPNPLGGPVGDVRFAPS